MTSLAAILDAYVARSDEERRDVARIRALPVGGAWSRSSALHVTGSAVVVHPPTKRVLLRWHERMQAWLQVGGHADAGETDPFAIARREAVEETGLTDLVAWPPTERPLLLHAVIVPVPAGAREPAHEHADLRFVLATEDPDAIVAESANARLQWLSLGDAFVVVSEDNLRTTLARAAELMVSVSRHRMMRGADVRDVLDLLEGAGIVAWVDGGWGVDALLGAPTRAHNDLDLVINHFDAARYIATMTTAGYRPKPTDAGTPRNFVMLDDSGREVDVHLVDLDVVVEVPGHAAVYGPNGLEYEVGSLEGQGTIDGRRVRCCTAAFQVQSHSTYEPDLDDYRDVLALHERFGIPLPAIYERFRA